MPFYAINFFPTVTLITPTLEEAAILLGRDIVSLDNMKCAAQDLHRLGPKCVLIKGNHLAADASQQLQEHSDQDDDVVGVLFNGVDFTLFKSPRLSIKTAYSTRCILSAAITAFLAYGIDMKRAIQDAIAYTRFVAQNSWTGDRNNDASKPALPVLVSQLPDKSLVVNQQQQPLLESRDHIVLVKNHCWIEEPRIFPQKRSFVHLLKNACAQEWVCAFPFISFYDKKRIQNQFLFSSTILTISSYKSWRTALYHTRASSIT